MGQGREHERLARQTLKGSADPEPLVAQIEVGPLEPGDVASAHPAVAGEIERAVKPMELRRGYWRSRALRLSAVERPLPILGELARLPNGAGVVTGRAVH